ncbi:MAG: glycosyltransferase family 2 protein [Parachlamydiaceae bacterium]|nr:glycosyltransferase family 2 protein [Parachlamydiaceae bacterium]
MTHLNNPCSFFTIITVVLNDINGLIRTKTSLHEQIFRDFEWIVIDGKSTDGCLEFIERQKDELTKWISEKDSGIYDAMNKGIKLSSGNYILFLNAGDTLFNEDTLMKIYMIIESQKINPDVLFGDSNYIFKNNKNIVRSTKIIEEYIWHGLPANHQSTLYKRDIIINNLYDLKYKLCNDYYIISVLYQKGINVFYLDFVVSNFFVGGISLKLTKNLFWEPFKIQKEVLGTSFHKRLHSLFKRFYSTFALYLFYMYSQYSVKD